MTERDQRVRSGGKETSKGGENRGGRLVEGQREGTRRRYGKMEGGERKARGRREMPDGWTKTQRE